MQGCANPGAIAIKMNILCRVPPLKQRAENKSTLKGAPKVIPKYFEVLQPHLRGFRSLSAPLGAGLHFSCNCPDIFLLRRLGLVVPLVNLCVCRSGCSNKLRVWCVGDGSEADIEIFSILAATAGFL